MLWVDSWGCGHSWNNSWSICAWGRACFCGIVGASLGSGVGAPIPVSCTLQPWLGATCPTVTLWVVGAICWVFFGWAELALCYVLSLSSFLQGFLYDLDKVSGISVSSPLYSPSLYLGCATASPSLLALPAALSPLEGEGLGFCRQGGPAGQRMKQR